MLETAEKSLHLSCESELTRQGISLPLDRQGYGRRLLGFRLNANTFFVNLPAPGRCRTLYIILRFSRVLCFC